MSWIIGLTNSRVFSTNFILEYRRSEVISSSGYIQTDLLICNSDSQSDRIQCDFIDHEWLFSSLSMTILFINAARQCKMGLAIITRIKDQFQPVSNILCIDSNWYKSCIQMRSKFFHWCSLKLWVLGSTLYLSPSFSVSFNLTAFICLYLSLSFSLIDSFNYTTLEYSGQLSLSLSKSFNQFVQASWSLMNCRLMMLFRC